jgi:16S rRNA C1402 N4-methylase RsmH
MSGHIPVMLEEVLATLQPRPGAIYLDATFGGVAANTTRDPNSLLRW